VESFVVRTAVERPECGGGAASTEPGALQTVSGGSVTTPSAGDDP